MIHSVHLSGINRRFISNKPQVYNHESAYKKCLREE